AARDNARVHDLRFDESYRFHLIVQDHAQILIGVGAGPGSQTLRACLSQRENNFVTVSAATANGGSVAEIAAANDRREFNYHPFLESGSVHYVWRVVCNITFRVKQNSTIGRNRSAAIQRRDRLLFGRI